MQPVNSAPDAERYSTVAIWLHWAIAILILFNLALGFFMEDFPPPLKFIIIPAHISSGITVLILTVVRIVWRLTHRPPPLSADMHGWERALAHLVHAALYLGMILLPLSGWALISANPPKGSPVALEKTRQFEEALKAGEKVEPPHFSGGWSLWWVAPLPAIAPISNIGAEQSGVERQHELHDQFVEAHEIGAYVMLLLLALHIAGALKHQYFDGQNELSRMGIGRRAP